MGNSVVLVILGVARISVVLVILGVASWRPRCGEQCGVGDTRGGELETQSSIQFETVQIALN